MLQAGEVRDAVVADIQHPQSWDQLQAHEIRQDILLDVPGYKSASLCLRACAAAGALRASEIKQ